MDAEREAYNKLSAVLVNRPVAIREFDQIYMRAGDMLEHLRVAGRALDGREVAFIGDGDAVALAFAYLLHEGVIPQGPKRCMVFDFDERIVNSINAFAKANQIAHRIEAQFYNVADAFPSSHLGGFNGFHTNPPFGQRNEGRSLFAFLNRCVEACSGRAVGCLVAGDDESAAWTGPLISSAQRHMAEYNYRVAAMHPACHRYHLDDAPDLTSGTIIFSSNEHLDKSGYSSKIPPEWIANFYGRNRPLTTRRIVDRTDGQRYPSHDYTIEPYE